MFHTFQLPVDIIAQNLLSDLGWVQIQKEFVRKTLQQLVDDYPCFLNIDENIWDPRNNHPDHMGAGCRRNRSSLCLSITAATITNANGCVVVAASDVAPHITVHENYTHDDMLRKSPHGMTGAAILATHMHHLARTDSRAIGDGTINANGSKWVGNASPNTLRATSSLIHCNLCKLHLTPRYLNYISIAIVASMHFCAVGGGGRGVLYGIDSCPNYIVVHRIKIVGHCVPTRNAITRVMLSLREGARWGVVGWGGCMIFVTLLFVNQVRDVCQKK